MHRSVNSNNSNIIQICNFSDTESYKELWLLFYGLSREKFLYLTHFASDSVLAVFTDEGEAKLVEKALAHVLFNGKSLICKRYDISSSSKHFTPSIIPAILKKDSETARNGSKCADSGLAPANKKLKIQTRFNTDHTY